jgi:3-oxoacyl-[acyl-carrier protein] reductase
MSFSCDLAKSSELASFIDFVDASLSRLDVLINNAAIHGPIGPLAESNLPAWQQALKVNLWAPVFLCHGLIPLMRRSGNGSIINLSGGGATAPRANFSSYATAKAALVRFSETLAEELRSDGIRVNCIAPGAMKTDLLREVVVKGALAGTRELSAANEAINNGGASMDHVADLALFLAGDASRGVTGKLVSALWDDWENWPEHLEMLATSDVYTLRRITGRDRGFEWGDK